MKEQFKRSFIMNKAVTDTRSLLHFWFVFWYVVKPSKQ